MIVTTSIPAAPAIGRRTILRNALVIGSLLALPAAVVGRPSPASAALSDQDMADLARVEQYMDSIITMQARFQQVEQNGRLAFGTIYLRKPGRLRVEYDTMPIRVVADGGLISYYDAELDQLSQLPLRQSTAWFLVRHPIDLSDGITVSQIDRSPGGLQLRMYQTDEPEAGSVSLIFYENPLTLAQWTVTDAQNKEVRVGLTDVRTGIDIPNEKFQTPRTCRQTDTCIGGAASRGRNNH
ncbi:MAG: outer membrane lipoprotein carrier protein LolA [Dongiaceae bacterium]